MSEHWPGTTELPQNGTHRVVRGNRAERGTWEFLKPVSPRPHLPAWTTLESEAGAWSVDNAVMLAGQHSGAFPGKETVWIEPIRPLKPAAS